MSKTATLSFRVDPVFVEETNALAAFAGFTNKTDYLKQAVIEKNNRVLAERIRFLSKQLSANSLAANEDMETTVGDGLA